MQLQYDTFKKHLGEICSIWIDAIDFEKGGIFFDWGPFDKAADRSTEKNFLMHVRQIYNFSAGFEYAAKEYGEAAHHLYHSLPTVFKKKHGLYLSSFYNRSRKKNFQWSKITGCHSYDLFYGVIGLSKYAAVFENEDCFQQTLQLFLKTREHFAIDGDPANGFLTIDAMDGTGPQRVTGNAHLHHYEALVNLMLASKRIFSSEKHEQNLAVFRPMIHHAHELFRSKLFDKDLVVTPDGFENNFTRGERYRYSNVTLGHVLEWLGFFIESQQLSGVAAPFDKEEFVEVADITLRRAINPLGAFENNFYLFEKQTAPRTCFWAQSEALLGCLYLYKLSGGEKRFIEAAEKIGEFYFQYFLDKEAPGIFSEVFSNGVVQDRRKGGAWKCDHHSLRMCEKILAYNLLDPGDD